jgi:hypothetical protein
VDNVAKALNIYNTADYSAYLSTIQLPRGLTNTPSMEKL